ncbi:Protein kinase alk2 [Stygiomarasmius scandens]|uniref:Protein kinase alk2 n=1 Tax=Marasmiellus scandens TaxID=2682957 RepID=A0ABR1IZ24_9AGAR
MAPIGLFYLVRNILPRLVLPLLLVYGGLKLTDGYFGYRWPSWLIVLALFLTHPVYFVVSSLYFSLKHQRQAASRNAVLPPQVQLGSVSIVRAVIESFARGYPGDVYHEWSKTYGNYFDVNIFGESQIVTFEPDHVKAILATQFDSFAKGPIVFWQLGSLLGSGVFNSDGEMWKFHRNMTRPFFTKERVSDYDVFDRHAEDIISAMKARIEEGYPIEFQDAVSRFTLDSATEFLFGKDVNSLSAGLPYPPSVSSPDILKGFVRDHPSNRFARAFLEGQELTATRTRYGKHWRLREIWGDEVEKRRLVVDEFINPIIEGARQRKEKVTGEEKVEEETFLDHLIEYTEDKQILGDELLNMLVASRDTTASLLTFAVYVLSQRSDVEKRLRDEIYEMVGSSARPTYKHIKEMKYLRAFINETLRLYPPVPFDGRASTTSTVFPSKTGPPVFIPEGTKCLYSVFLMHRRKDLWGPDALEFDPDRFLDFRLHKYLTPNPFIFVPFNAGPRICLGQQFAYNEASFFLVKLLQNFQEIKFAEDVQYTIPEDGPVHVRPPEEWAKAQREGRQEMKDTTKGRDKVMFTTHLTMCVRGGLWVRMSSMKDNGVAVV